MSSTLQRPALPYIAPPCSPHGSLAAPPSLLPLKRPCPLSWTKTAIPNSKFGVYIMYIYIYTLQQTSSLSLLPPPTPSLTTSTFAKPPPHRLPARAPKVWDCVAGEGGEDWGWWWWDEGASVWKWWVGVVLRLWIFDASGGKVSTTTAPRWYGWSFNI